MKEFSEKMRRLHDTANEKLDKGTDFVFEPLLKLNATLMNLPGKNNITKLIQIFFFIAGVIAFIKFKEAPIYALYPIYFFALWPVIFFILGIFFLIAPYLIRMPPKIVLRYTLGWFFMPKDLLVEVIIILLWALILAALF